MTTSVPTRSSGKIGSRFDLNPLSVLREEMNDLFGRFSTDFGGGFLSAGQMPSVDLSETDSAVEIKVDLPGIKPDEVDIEVSSDSIRISGEHKEEKEDIGKTFHRVERRSGSFSRHISLPCAIDQENVVAESRDGVLTISLPKTADSKTRKVPVKG